MEITHKNYMKRACLLCDNSKCGYKTGAVLVKDGQVLAEGWNETLKGEVYCQGGSCVRTLEKLSGGKEPDKVCSIHAEASAVAQCASLGKATAGAEIYVTTYPCITCCRLLARAGVAKVYFMSQYMGGRIGEPVLQAHNIAVVELKEREVWQ